MTPAAIAAEDDTLAVADKIAADTSQLLNFGCYRGTAIVIVAAICRQLMQVKSNVSRPNTTTAI